MSYMAEVEEDRTKKPNALVAALRKYPRLGVFLLLLVASIVLSKGLFLSPANLHNMLRQFASIGIMAVGQTYAILLAGVDLSQGSVIALVSMTLALFNTKGYGMVLPLVIALGVGLACGAFNGLVVTKGKVPPFIATLSMAGIARGIATMIAEGRPIYGLSEGYAVFGREAILGVGVQIFIWLNVVLLGMFLLKRTVYGRYVYMVGGNEKCSRLSGIKIDAVKVIGYMISGLCAAIAGIVITSKLDMGGPYMSLNDNVQSVASVVIGGTSFAGGRGSVEGTLIGTLIIAMINNLMNLLLINPFIQQGVIGVIILATVYMNQKREGRKY